MEKKCCFTGHRPKSLPFGYNEEEPSCKKLKELLDVGILTQDEFDSKKKQILGL